MIPMFVLKSVEKFVKWFEPGVNESSNSKELELKFVLQFKLQLVVKSIPWFANEIGIGIGIDGIVPMTTWNPGS